MQKSEEPLEVFCCFSLGEDPSSELSLNAVCDKWDLCIQSIRLQDGQKQQFGWKHDLELGSCCCRNQPLGEDFLEALKSL